jgi:hypothetical protein
MFDQKKKCHFGKGGIRKVLKVSRIILMTPKLNDRLKKSLEKLVKEEQQFVLNILHILVDISELKMSRKIESTNSKTYLHNFLSQCLNVTSEY